MIDDELRLFLDAAEPLLASAESEISQLEAQASLTTNVLRARLEMPQDALAQLAEHVRGVRETMNSVRRSVNVNLRAALEASRKLESAIADFDGDVQVRCDEVVDLADLPVEIAGVATQKFGQLAGGIQEAREAAQSLASGTIDEFRETLDAFEEQWAETSDSLKQSTGDLVSKMGQEIANALVDRATAELGCLTGDVLDNVRRVGETVDDLAGNLRSAFNDVGNAMSAVSRTIGAARPVLEAMSAVT